MSLASLVALSLIGGAYSFDCSIPPIYIDVHKRAVHGGGAQEYGSFVGFGTASQNMSLWVSLSANETSVADPDFCKKSNLTDCDNATGGFFDSALSSTWKQVDDYKTTDEDEQARKNTGSFGEDKIHLYQHFIESQSATETAMDNFPFMLTDNGTSEPGKLGLGSRSTLLGRLSATSLTAGKSFSFYTGTAYERAGGAINGSLTLGGYDASRFKGTVYNETMNLTHSNPFRVRVADIVISDPSGGQKDRSLFDTSRFPNLEEGFSGFDAHISTDEFPLSLPYEVTQNFISMLAAESSDNLDGSLRLTKPFAGSMSIKLSNGLSVTLPKEMMFNASGLSPVAARDKDSSAPFALGLAWLTQVYLMADYDAGAFHLAQAVPEARFISVRTTCPKVVPLPYGGAGGKNFSRMGLIGAVVGGIVGGLALAFVLWFALSHLLLWRRSRAARKLAEGTLAHKLADLEGR
ncbi:MAG: hypothetical protein M1832_002777 [Thelocarpon impressellum]|nr:MAG: hypothetical protein M1832_002777 [Thelocarpon impressellum]